MGSVPNIISCKLLAKGYYSECLSVCPFCPNPTFSYPTLSLAIETAVLKVTGLYSLCLFQINASFVWIAFTRTLSKQKGLALKEKTQCFLHFAALTRTASIKTTQDDFILLSHKIILLFWQLICCHIYLCWRYVRLAFRFIATIPHLGYERFPARRITRHSSAWFRTLSGKLINICTWNICERGSTLFRKRF